MFSKDSKSTLTPASTPSTAAPAADPARSAASRTAAPSIISSDLKIKGDLICNGDIQIDGTIEGDVVSRSITVGEGADVPGADQSSQGAALRSGQRDPVWARR